MRIILFSATYCHYTQIFPTKFMLLSIVVPFSKTCNWLLWHIMKKVYKIISWCLLYIEFHSKFYWYFAVEFHWFEFSLSPFFLLFYLDFIIVTQAYNKIDSFWLQRMDFYCRQKCSLKLNAIHQYMLAFLLYIFIGKYIIAIEITAQENET